MARFYIDCEFDGHGGPLLSFAIVDENGGALHLRVNDAGPVCDPWVAENVIPIMGDCPGFTLFASVPLNHVGRELREFIGTCDPVIIADSPVDIGRFCQALSTGEDGGWASADYPLMRFEVHNVDCWPNEMLGGVQHNAAWDAMALRHKLASVRP